MLRNQLSSAAERHINELRDTADQDYILARVAFRYQLDPSFIWLAQQAVEKYLKALLLFNGCSAQGLGHQLRPALERLVKINDIPFRDFPATVVNFIDYLDHRADRYAELSYAVSTQRLVDLDAVVWNLRRFCLNVRGNREPRLQVTAAVIRERVERHSEPTFNREPHRFRLTPGYLEDLRRQTNSPLKRHLTWQNLYFSRRKRTAVSASRSRAVESWLVLHPEIIPELRDRLPFSRAAKRRYRI